jgi:hypothetical protein
MLHQTWLPEFQAATHLKSGEKTMIVTQAAEEDYAGFGTFISNRAAIICWTQSDKPEEPCCKNSI